MKKIVKKIIAGMLTLCVMLSVLPAMPVKAADTIRPIAVNKEEVVTFASRDESVILSFTSPARGYFTVDVTCPIGSDYSEYISLLNSSNQGIYDSRLSTPIYATDANRKFYIKLSHYNNNRYDNDSVTVKVNYVVTNDWESEENDSMETADLLTSGKYVYGVMEYHNRTDDYYKFKIKKDSKVTIYMGPKTVDGEDHGWWARLVNRDNEERELNQASNTLYLKKGTYYIKIRNSYSADTGIPYKLKYKASTVAVKKPTITSCKIKKKSNVFGKYGVITTLKMKKNKDVTGYQVQAASKKNMSGKTLNQKLDIGTGVSKTSISKLRDYQMKYKKTYYVRVRGYVKDAFGKVIYGKYSNVKKIKTK